MKMKRLIFLVVLFIPSMAYLQTIEKDEKTGKYACSGVVQIDSVSKDRLFAKTMEWIALNYKSANDVIQLSNKEDGKIICKGNFKTMVLLTSGYIGHTLTLDFKDGKFRYQYTNFAFVTPGNELHFESAMAARKKTISNTEEYIRDSIRSLTNYIKSGKSDDDGW